MKKAAIPKRKPRSGAGGAEQKGTPGDSAFYGLPLPGVDLRELSGSLIVIEGIDGSGRSTQISLLKEWLESEGYAVQTAGLRRSNLMGPNIDDLMAKNAVTPLTLALVYATDFFDQIENVIVPALRAGLIVLADRYIYTLIARAAVRGIGERYLNDIYQMAIKPHRTFWLNVPPQQAFEREFRKSNAVSYWESGRDMHLSSDLYQSFILYQTRIERQFEMLARRHGFNMIDAAGTIAHTNRQLRQGIAGFLGIRRINYHPSPAFLRLWQEGGG